MKKKKKKAKKQKPKLNKWQNKKKKDGKLHETKSLVSKQKKGVKNLRLFLPQTNRVYWKEKINGKVVFFSI